MKILVADKLLEALQFAASRHAHNTSVNAPGQPYINHPIAVAHALTREGGVDDLTTLCAALLHDTVEKAGATEQEIRKQFGIPIAMLVAELTDPPQAGEQERHALQVRQAPVLSHPGKLIRLADKLCNLRDVVASRRRVKPSPHDTAAHFAWCAQVVDGLRGANARLEAALDEVMRHSP